MRRIMALDEIRSKTTTTPTHVESQTAIISSSRRNPRGVPAVYMLQQFLTIAVVFMAILQSQIMIVNGTNLGSKCQHDMDCTDFIKGSSCSATGYCECAPYFVQYDENTCLSSQLLGGDCLLDDQCTMKVANSSCSDGACRCVEGFLQFRKHTCLGPALPGAVCYSHAHCQMFDERTHCDFLIPNLFGRCSCTAPTKLFGGQCMDPEATTTPVTPTTTTSTTEVPAVVGQQHEQELEVEVEPESEIAEINVPKLEAEVVQTQQENVEPVQQEPVQQNEVHSETTVQHIMLTPAEVTTERTEQTPVANVATEPVTEDYPYKIDDEYSELQQQQQQQHAVDEPLKTEQSVENDTLEDTAQQQNIQDISEEEENENEKPQSIEQPSEEIIENHHEQTETPENVEVDTDLAEDTMKFDYDATQDEYENENEQEQEHVTPADEYHETKLEIVPDQEDAPSEQHLTELEVKPETIEIHAEQIQPVALEENSIEEEEEKQETHNMITEGNTMHEDHTEPSQHNAEIESETNKDEISTIEEHHDIEAESEVEQVLDTKSEMPIAQTTNNPVAEEMSTENHIAPLLENELENASKIEEAEPSSVISDVDVPVVGEDSSEEPDAEESELVSKIEVSETPEIETAEQPHREEEVQNNENEETATQSPDLLPDSEDKIQQQLPQKDNITESDLQHLNPSKEVIGSDSSDAEHAYENEIEGAEPIPEDDKIPAKEATKLENEETQTSSNIRPEIEQNQATPTIELELPEQQTTQGIREVAESPVTQEDKTNASELQSPEPVKSNIEETHADEIEASGNDSNSNENAISTDNFKESESIADILGDLMGEEENEEATTTGASSESQAPDLLAEDTSLSEEHIATEKEPAAVQEQLAEVLVNTINPNDAINQEVSNLEFEVNKTDQPSQTHSPDSLLPIDVSPIEEYKPQTLESDSLVTEESNADVEKYESSATETFKSDEEATATASPSDHIEITTQTMLGLASRVTLMEPAAPIVTTLKPLMASPSATEEVAASEIATPEPEPAKSTTMTTTHAVVVMEDRLDASTNTKPSTEIRKRVDLGLEAVSLGLSCVNDKQCQLADPHTVCNTRGVCDCAASLFSTTSNTCNAKHTGCSKGTFQCRSSGVCISWFFVCDGRDDCNDASDEECSHNSRLNQTCPAEAFLCAQSGRCISRAALCDGRKQCPHGEDEFGCAGVMSTNGITSCPSHTFRCNSGECLPEYEYCNAIISCKDGSDEPPHLCGERAMPSFFQRLLKAGGLMYSGSTNNPAGYCPHRCSNGRCRSTAIVCSGRDGCGDGTDEQTCSVCRCPAPTGLNLSAYLSQKRPMPLW